MATNSIKDDLNKTLAYNECFIKTLQAAKDKDFANMTTSEMFAVVVAVNDALKTAMQAVEITKKNLEQINTFGENADKESI